MASGDIPTLPWPGQEGSSTSNLRDLGNFSTFHHDVGTFVTIPSQAPGSDASLLQPLSPVGPAIDGMRPGRPTSTNHRRNTGPVSLNSLPLFLTGEEVELIVPELQHSTFDREHLHHHGDTAGLNDGCGRDFSSSSPLYIAQRRGELRSLPHLTLHPHPSVLIKLFPLVRPDRATLLAMPGLGVGDISRRYSTPLLSSITFSDISSPPRPRGLHLSRSTPRCRNTTAMQVRDTTTKPRAFRDSDYLDESIELTEDEKIHYFDDLQRRYRQMRARLAVLQQRHENLTRRLQAEDLGTTSGRESASVATDLEVIVYFNNTDLACSCFAYSRSRSTGGLWDSTLICSKTKVTPTILASPARSDLSALLIAAKFLANLILGIDTKPYRVSILGNSDVTSSGITPAQEQGQSPLIRLLREIDQVLSGIGSQTSHSMFQELSPEQIETARNRTMVDAVHWVNTAPPPPRRRRWNSANYNGEDFIDIHQRAPSMISRDRSTWRASIHQAFTPRGQHLDQ